MELLRAAEHPTAQVVHAAAGVLRAGGAVVLPTDTVYGVAALASLPGATAQLWRLKGRRDDQPFAVLVADLDQGLALLDLSSPPAPADERDGGVRDGNEGEGDGGARDGDECGVRDGGEGDGGVRDGGVRDGGEHGGGGDVASAPSERRALVRAWTERFWPGALTVVGPRSAAARPLELGPTALDTIGVRCPANPIVRALAAEVGPLATTSANRSGEPTARDAEAAAASLAEAVPIVIDGGPAGTVASTVVDVTVTPWRVLRVGAIPPEALVLAR